MTRPSGNHGVAPTSVAARRVRRPTRALAGRRRLSVQSRAAVGKFVRTRSPVCDDWRVGQGFCLPEAKPTVAAWGGFRKKRLLPCHSIILGWARHSRAGGNLGDWGAPPFRLDSRLRGNDGSDPKINPGQGTIAATT